MFRISMEMYTNQCFEINISSLFLGNIELTMYHFSRHKIDGRLHHNDSCFYKLFYFILSEKLLKKLGTISLIKNISRNQINIRSDSQIFFIGLQLYEMPTSKQT